MTTTFETISVDQLAPVTGGGIGTQIGSMFGAKGAQWGGLADSIFGMFQGGGGGGGGILGNLGKMFGGGSSPSSSGSSSSAPADSGGSSGM